MIDVNDEIARRKARSLRQEVLCALLAPLANEPVTQNILLADHSQFIRLEAGLQTENNQ